MCVIRVLKSLAVGVEERREWEYLDTMAELAKAMVDEVRERGAAELAQRDLARDPRLAETPARGGLALLRLDLEVVLAAQHDQVLDRRRATIGGSDLVMDLQVEVLPQTAQPAPGLESSCLRTFAAPGRAQARFDGDRTMWCLQRDPFRILRRQIVQKLWGITDQPKILVGAGSGAVALS